jgi:hypothetical protein
MWSQPTGLILLAIRRPYGGMGEGWGENAHSSVSVAILIQLPAAAELPTLKLIICRKYFLFQCSKSM